MRIKRWSHTCNGFVRWVATALKGSIREAPSCI
jgi:hypothetical protein